MVISEQSGTETVFYFELCSNCEILKKVLLTGDMERSSCVERARPRRAVEKDIYPDTVRISKGRDMKRERKAE